MPKKDLILLALETSPTLDLMMRVLRASGFEVAVAHNRESMDKSIQEAFPALIVVGEQFEGGDVFTIAADVLDRFPTIPIVLYSSQETPQLAMSAIQAGMSGYLHAPLRTDDIVNEIKRSMIRAGKLGDWLRREVKRTTASLEQKAKISEAERSKLEAIISNIQDGVLVMDEKRNILFANQTIHEIFGLSEFPIEGKHVHDVISNADLNALIDRARDGVLKYHEVNFDDGRVFNAQYAPIPRIGSAVTMQDISYIKEIDRLKNDFVHTVSHDLRSPLTSVLGYMELIERVGTLNESQQEFLKRLQASVHHMTNLVNELLDLGRLESGFDTRRESVHLQNVLEYSLAVFDTQIKNKNIQIQTEISGSLKPLRANPIRIRQMIDNLLGNAIKYTPEGGIVKVGMAMQENQLVLRIQDSGPGIPADEQSRVFEKFFRASNRPEGVEGSGLGLAIVKSVVDSHQGRVWVESKLGFGSAFVVLLPTSVV
ncbi:MAG: PAS domain S-box protein [Anaerolineales bacterium]|nr:PAS domain S-box protein [Anaerolineales bacterium]MCB9146949.1 PAS domain S-box protein [Anaerolineales bacterium]